MLQTCAAHEHTFLDSAYNVLDQTSSQFSFTSVYKCVMCIMCITHAHFHNKPPHHESALQTIHKLYQRKTTEISLSFSVLKDVHSQPN